MKKFLLIPFLLVAACLPQGEDADKHNVLAYQQHGLWGLEDKNGEAITRPKFEFIGHFQPPKNIALVKMMGLYGYIREDGSFLLEPQYQKATDLINGQATVYRNDIWYQVILKPEGGFRIKHLAKHEAQKIQVASLPESAASKERNKADKKSLFDKLTAKTEKTEAEKIQEERERIRKRGEARERKERAIASNRVGEKLAKESQNGQSAMSAGGASQGGDGKKQEAKSKGAMDSVKQMKKNIEKNRKATMEAANDM